MLQTVEVLPGHRDAIRRAVSLEANLMSSEWEGPRKHRVLDLSPEGMCLAAAGRLPIGERVAVSFTPPGWWVLGELTLFAWVRRSEPRGDGPATLGLEFLDLRPGARALLEASLEGRPPRLPCHTPRTELVWIDALITWQEDLGDRVNTFEVSEAIAPIFDGMIDPRAIGPLLGAKDLSAA